MEIIADMIELHIARRIGDELEFLLLKRSDKDIYPGLWQMVSGHIIMRETAVATALRELKEETGIEPLHLWVVPNVNSFYSADTDNISLIPVFVVLAKENDEVIISDEHSEFMWVSPAKAKKLLAWDGQRKSVDLIEEYFLREMKFLQFTEIDLAPYLRKI